MAYVRINGHLVAYEDIKPALGFIAPKQETTSQKLLAVIAFVSFLAIVFGGLAL